MLIKKIGTFALFNLLFIGSQVAQGETKGPLYSPLGQWKTEDGRATVDIQPCGKKVCGKIISLSEPLDSETHKPKMDTENQDISLKKRPLMGLQIISDFTPDATIPNHWVDGKIYSPREGKTYNAQFTLENPRQMNIRGYVGIPLFGKTQIWTKLSK